MSYQSRQSLDPAARTAAREGAATVGKLEHLDGQGRMVVALLRGASLPGREDDIAKVFGQMMMVFERHARRPLMRHHSDCACLGADEAVMAQFVRLAARGAREDAMLMAMLLLRADIAPLAVSMAEQLGLLINSVARAMPQAMPPRGMYH